MWEVAGNVGLAVLLVNVVLLLVMWGTGDEK